VFYDGYIFTYVTTLPHPGCIRFRIPYLLKFGHTHGASTKNTNQMKWIASLQRIFILGQVDRLYCANTVIAINGFDHLKSQIDDALYCWHSKLVQSNAIPESKMLSTIISTYGKIV
jgi:hypothetical protein